MSTPLGVPFRAVGRTAAVGARGALWPLGTAVRVGDAAQRSARRAAGAAAAGVTLVVLDAVLEAHVTDEAIARVAQSPSAERAVVGFLSAPMAERVMTTALSGPLID